jgi:hypothetical protein
MQDWLDAEPGAHGLRQSRSGIHAEHRNSESRASTVNSRLVEVETQLANVIEEHQQDERRHLAQYAVAHALAESASFDEAAPGILRAICEGVKWDFGAIWMLDTKTEELRCFAIWSRTATAPSIRTFPMPRFPTSRVTVTEIR